MTPEAILKGLGNGMLRLPTLPDVNNELPPGYEFLDLAGAGLSFRQHLALNGEKDPGPDGAPEDWVAWFMDAMP